MFTNCDCSVLYVADRKHLIQTLSVLPEYLRNQATESGAVIDYRDWHVQLGRRFRSLKLWFVIRHYGVTGLQRHVRERRRLDARVARLGKAHALKGEERTGQRMEAEGLAFLQDVARLLAPDLDEERFEHDSSPAGSRASMSPRPRPPRLAIVIQKFTTVRPIQAPTDARTVAAEPCSTPNSAHPSREHRYQKSRYMMTTTAMNSPNTSTNDTMKAVPENTARSMPKEAPPES